MDANDFDPVRYKPDVRQRKLDYGKPYPEGRPVFYSNRYIRCLFKACAAQHVEPKGVNLLILIASLEDSKRYSDAVLYTDEQMLPVLKFNAKALVRVREKCVEHGWLHFEAGWTGVPSRYWTMVPQRVSMKTDMFDEDDLSWSRVKTHCRIDSTNDSRIDSTNDSRIDSTNDSRIDSTVFAKTSKDTLLPLSPTRGGGSECEIIDLAKELSDLGVCLAYEAAKAALGETSLSQCLRHVAHFREHLGAWGSTVLYHRMTSPNLIVHTPDAAWPKPLPAYEWKLKNQASHEHRKRFLEKEYGPIVDAMTEAELAAFAPDPEQRSVEVYRADGIDPTARFLALESIHLRTARERQERRILEVETAKSQQAAEQQLLPSVDWLEETYGTNLDTLNEIELAALVSRLGTGPARSLETFGRKLAMPMMRPELLKALHEQSSAN